MKRCWRCKETKPLSSYQKDKSRGDGLRRYCRDCGREMTAEWRVRNIERSRELVRNNYARHAETYAAMARNYYESNKETVQQYKKDYRRNNPIKIRNINEDMRAKRMAAFVEKVDREIVFDRDHGVCHLCGNFVDPNNWHLEHINPITKGGLHCYDNVAVAHPSCNWRKYNKIIDLGEEDDLSLT